MGDPVNATLSPRASVALLTLQRRAAVRQAEEAEQAEREWDGDAAAAELRERLEPMVRDQRRTFEVELWQARAAAAARVAAVRDELAARRAAESAASAAATADTHAEAEDTLAEVVEVADVVESPDAVMPAADEVVEVHEAVAGVPLASPPVDAVPVDVPPSAEWIDADDAGPQTSPHVVGSSQEDVTGTRDDSGAAWSRPAPESAGTLTADDVRSIVDEAIDRFAARQAAAPPPNQGMDPEAFSRAFAAAFGAAFSAMLDERVAALNAGPAVAPPWVRYAPQAPVEIKKSFWTNMWHADVMLSVLAAVIVLVVLIAWST